MTVISLNIEGLSSAKEDLIARYDTDRIGIEYPNSQKANQIA